MQKQFIRISNFGSVNIMKNKKSSRNPLRRFLKNILTLIPQLVFTLGILLSRIWNREKIEETLTNLDYKLWDWINNEV